jgi:purine-binding chemotaxis protein CheW
MFNASVRLLIFRLEEQRYALPLDAVVRVVRAVELTLLPGAPAIVLGAIDVQGSVVPVLSLRRRFGLAQSEIGPDDQFVLARTASRAVALVIDEAQGVIEHPAGAIIDSTEILPGVGHFRGVVKLEDGLVLIHDLDKFLSLDEASALDDAMGQEAADEA